MILKPDNLQLYTKSLVLIFELLNIIFKISLSPMVAGIIRKSP